MRAAREGIMASQSGKSEQADAMATWDVALETKVSVACGCGFDMQPWFFKCHAGGQLLDVK